MGAQIHAMSGPGDEYTKVMSLHEGAEAQIEDNREGWYLIKLPNGLGGWIPQETAEIIWRSTRYNIRGTKDEGVNCQGRNTNGYGTQGLKVI